MPNNIIITGDPRFDIITHHLTSENRESMYKEILEYVKKMTPP